MKKNRKLEDAMDCASVNVVGNLRKIASIIFGVTGNSYLVLPGGIEIGRNMKGQITFSENFWQGDLNKLLEVEQLLLNHLSLIAKYNTYDLEQTKKEKFILKQEIDRLR